MGKNEDDQKVIVAVPNAVTKEDLEDEATEEVVEEENQEDQVSEENTPEDSEATEDNPPAKPSEDVEEETEVVQWDDEKFALANIARSLIQKDAGGLHEDSSEVVAGRVFSGATNVAGEEDEHSHEMFVEIVDGVAYGYTIRKDKADHYHVWEVQIEDGQEISGTTRSASSGPDHTHEFKLEACDAEEIPSLEDLTALVEEVEKINDDEEDARLSATQRKKLKGSSFCGPNRSFPVPDCAHVTAARRLVGRWKGSPEAKARVKACVNRKASRLGCDGGKKKDELEAPAAPETKVVPDAEVVEELKSAKADLEKVRRTLSEREQDVKSLTEELAKANANICKDLADKLVVIRAILKKKDCIGLTSREDWGELVTQYAERTEESIRDSIADLLPELDLVIRDGLRVHRPLITPENESKPKDSKVVAREDKTNTPDAKKARNRRMRLTHNKGSSIAGPDSLREDLE